MHVGSTPPIVGVVGGPFIVGVVVGVHGRSQPPMVGVRLGVGGVGGGSRLRHGDVRQRRWSSTWR